MTALDEARAEHEKAGKHYWALTDRYDINRRTSAQSEEINIAHKLCVVANLRLGRAKSEAMEAERKARVFANDLPLRSV